MMNFKTKVIQTDDLDLIKGLWEKLNQIHFEDSRYFKEHYATFTFEKRCENFRMMNSQYIHIEIIENDESGIIGYCISTVKEDIGEIESLFVEDAYRKHGLGKMLVEQATIWLKGFNCKKIQLSVADGHEAVFEFYMSNGFYPRLTYLELKV